MADVPTSQSSDEEKFLKFVYPEVKDLSKHFLTVVSAVFVLSVTFSEKIVVFSTARQAEKGLIALAWLLWIVAIITCGAAIFLNFVTATDALRGRMEKLTSSVRFCYLCLDIAGLAFVIGLLLLGIVAFMKS